MPPPSLKRASRINRGHGGRAEQLSKAFEEITRKPKKTTTEPVIPDDVPNNPMAIPPRATRKTHKVGNQY